jgi:hypothetical protein
MAGCVYHSLQLSKDGTIDSTGTGTFGCRSVGTLVPDWAFARISLMSPATKDSLFH